MPLRRLAAYTPGLGDGLGAPLKLGLRLLCVAAANAEAPDPRRVVWMAVEVKQVGSSPLEPLWSLPANHARLAGAKLRKRKLLDAPVPHCLPLSYVLIVHLSAQERPPHALPRTRPAELPKYLHSHVAGRGSPKD